MPTQQELRATFTYEPDSGRLLWRRSLREFGSIDGSNGYRVGTLHYKRLYTHRAVWMMHNGLIPTGRVIDHYDRDKLNNRIENLRCVTHTQNHQNERRRGSNTSGFTGVYFSKQKQKWAAKLIVNGRQKHLGFFEKLSDAVEARTAALARYGFTPHHGSMLK